MAGKVISRFQSGSGIHLISSTFYGTCNTDADEPIKEVKINDEHVTELKLIPGMLLSVKFTNGNTATNPQLKILDSNNNILKDAILIAPDTLIWGAGNILLFVYDNNNNNERWISNYLSLSGGTLTGKLNIQDSDMDIATTPSSDQYDRVFEVHDSNDKEIMNITAVHPTNNYHGFSIGVYDPDTEQQNTIQLIQNNNNGYKVWISQPAAWRSALGIGTIGTKGTLTASDIPALPYLSTSGGTVSGDNIIAKSTNIKDGTKPSSDTVGNARLLFNGSDNNGLGWVDFINFASGVQAIRLYARRIISSTTHYTGLALGLNSSGNATVTIQGTNAQDAWLTALGFSPIYYRDGTDFSDVFTAASGFTVDTDTFRYSQRGKFATVLIAVKNTSALTAGTFYTIGTLASGRRPYTQAPLTDTALGTVALAGIVYGSGIVSVRPRGNVPANSSIVVGGTIILA